MCLQQFGLPGAFTRTCSTMHLPGFVDLADQIRDHVSVGVMDTTPPMALACSLAALCLCVLAGCGHDHLLVLQ